MPSLVDVISAHLHNILKLLAQELFPDNFLKISQLHDMLKYCFPRLRALIQTSSSLIRICIVS